MRIQNCYPAWLASAVCMIAGLSFAAADDAPGVFRMTGSQPAPIRQTGFFRSALHSQNDDCCTPECGEVGCCPTAEGCCVADQCCPDAVEACCDTPGSRGGCGCGCSGTDDGSLLSRMFGGPKSRCSCDLCEYCGKGGSGAVFDENRTMADLLFGCMTPSGACGQGAPLIGKYQITYASQPSYADPRDGLAWGAQGYGMPITVPAAPVVRYSYNYSHGTPASRLTPLSTYNPTTSPQALFLQSW